MDREQEILRYLRFLKKGIADKEEMVLFLATNKDYQNAFRLDTCASMQKVDLDTTCTIFGINPKEIE